MSLYTNVDSVKALFRRIKILPDTGNDAQNTVVTTEEVEEFIIEVETMVKARLSTCYVMSSVGPESIVIIGMACKYLVADIIRNILELTSNVSSERKNQDVTGNWYKKAHEILNKICPIDNCGECKEKPSMPLPDTPMINSAPKNASLFASASNIANFKKDVNNW